jgi:transposase-like protein
MKMATELATKFAVEICESRHDTEVDETYVKVKGEWTYLYRAVDKKGGSVAKNDF